MICSNGLPLMDVNALRTGLHAAAPMRPANSHVKVSVRTVQSTVSVTTPVNGYRCRTRGPTAQSLICWNISTRPSSPIPARICDSSTRSPVSPKRPTWPHIKIPQIRRSEPGPGDVLRREDDREKTVVGRADAQPSENVLVLARLYSGTTLNSTVNSYVTLFPRLRTSPLPATPAGVADRWWNIE